MKLVWRVAEQPTGQYRSFHVRGWPTADFKGTEQIAIQLSCKTEYIPSKVRTGDHDPITVMIADYSVAGLGFKWRKLKRQLPTLAEAKDAGLAALCERPEFHPK